jgi:hypothetical protein
VVSCRIVSAKVSSRVVNPAKVAISMNEILLRRLDRPVKSRSFRCRSQGVRKAACIFALLLGLTAPAQADSKLLVSTNFPGGSGQVEEIDSEARLIRLVPSPGPGWDCWWYVRVDGIRPGEELALDVGEGVWATPGQAVFSLDGREWHQTAPGKRHNERIVFRQKIDGDRAWFAWGPPFVLADAVALVKRAAAASPHAEAFELTRSREGRPVPALRVSQPGVPDKERFGIWIQARQHAWEAGSSWACKGFVDWLVSNDPRAENLRRKSLIKIVPIMDVDNVERGAGGKDQEPQDHNRDWTAQPHWPEVRAAIESISRMTNTGRFDLLIDLHNPAPRDRESYFFITPDDELSAAGRSSLERFLAAARDEMGGPIGFRGRTRPAANPVTARGWAQENTTEHVVATTLEIPWNTPDSTSENYQAVGRRLGLAIEKFCATGLNGR